MSLAVDTAEVANALRLLVEPDQTYEIRAIARTNYGRQEEILSGYFQGDASQAVTKLDSRDVISWYCTLNPVNEALWARRANRIGKAGKDSTTKDNHITRRTRLLIDVDPVRPSGISSSDEEHAESLALAWQIAAELTDAGWPDPMFADSGNGAHLIYAIDLPADDGGLVERVLAAAGARWSVGTIKVDTGNFNPARITKLYGTPARKGDSVPDRPHRLSRLLCAPDRLVPVTKEQLEAFVRDYAPAAAVSNGRTASTSTRPRTSIDVVELLARLGYAVRSSSPYSGKNENGTCYELETCPVDPDHSRGEAVVIQFDSGGISASCRHESCRFDWDWLKAQWLAAAPPRQNNGKSAHREPDDRDDHAPPRDAEVPDELGARRKKKPKPEPRFETGHGGHAGLGPAGGYRLTDLGNARRFADAHAGRLRYVAAWDQWLAWDGTRWRRDDLGIEMRAAKDVVARIYVEAATCAQQAAANGSGGSATDGGMAAELAKWARDCAKRARIDSMIALAQSELEIATSRDLFDRDLWLLNVANGTIDLRNGELRAHRASNMITMLAPVAYEPNAIAPHWEAFLERVLPDAEVRSWIQRYLGYALTGDVREQCLAFFVGGGANGKSVLVDVVLGILGDYGLRAAPDLVLARFGEAHPTEQADLEGKRFVVCSEIEQGRAWAESLIKRITGDSTITARRMRQDNYTFLATHKLVVAANTRPHVRGTDHGIWRRIRLAPWTVRIPEEEQDKELPQRLLVTEASGILAWLVRGCLAWQRQGLGSAVAIEAATAGYRTDEDVLGRWIEDRCEEGEALWDRSDALYKNYRSWCEEEGIERPWSRRIWHARMCERDGICDKRNTIARGLLGIQLRGNTQTWP